MSSNSIYLNVEKLKYILYHTFLFPSKWYKTNSFLIKWIYFVLKAKRQIYACFGDILIMVMFLSFPGKSDNIHVSLAKILYVLNRFGECDGFLYIIISYITTTIYPEKSSEAIEHLNLGLYKLFGF